MIRHRHSDDLTGDLFAFPRAAAQIDGTMDFRQPVSVMVGQMLESAHAAGLDRFEVASRASRLTGRDVSKAMLDGYTAPSRGGFNLPLWLAPVLEVVCSGTRLGQWHGEVVGGQLLLGAATLDAELGRLERERLQVAARIKALKDLSRRVR
ncbi:MAG: hypothetical protein ACRES5_05580 [Pseudomonas sp.]|uniref:hypothetical protein n=1 Tax=Stenotrophomonas sp. TaxID=69392 RepID=UPI003D6D67F8